VALEPEFGSLELECEDLTVLAIVDEKKPKKKKVIRQEIIFTAAAAASTRTPYPKRWTALSPSAVTASLRRSKWSCVLEARDVGSFSPQPAISSMPRLTMSTNAKTWIPSIKLSSQRYSCLPISIRVSSSGQNDL
jgi:hypothetical protein